MLTTLVSMICALSMSAVTSLTPVVSAASAADTVDVYVIDRVRIEKFDGSQLKGKTVLDYSITRKDGVRFHTITTMQGTVLDALKNLEGKGVAFSHPVILVDGVVQENSDILREIDPKNLQSITVIATPGTEEAKKYGEAGYKGGVLSVVTKSGVKVRGTSSPQMIYVINGKVASLSELNSVKPDNIKEMRVIKNPDSPEARKYNSGSGASVIIVTTK